MSHRILEALARPFGITDPKSPDPTAVRLLSVAGMAPNPEHPKEPIGFALIVEDVRKIIVAARERTRP